LFAGEDYLDPYYAAGAALELRHQLSPGWIFTLGGFAERQRSAELDSDFSFFGSLRPVLPVDPTDRLLGTRLTVERAALAEASRWWAGRLSIEVSDMKPRPGSAADTLGLAPWYVLPQAEISWGRRWMTRGAEL